MMAQALLLLYQLLDIRDAVTHKHADSIYKTGPVIFIQACLTWKPITVALLNTKRKLVNLPCFDFNVHTGGFTFYGTNVSGCPLEGRSSTHEQLMKNGTKLTTTWALNMFDGDPENDGPGDTWFQDNSTASGDLGRLPLLSLNCLLG